MITKKNPGAIIVDTGPDLLASAIDDVAKSARKLLDSRLSEKALVLLLSHHSGVSQRDCKRVLESAANLRFFLKKPKASE
jgi:hypothetical protein